MLNLDPKDAVVFNQQHKQAISQLILNRQARTGKELLDDKGPNDIFIEIKKAIRKNGLTIQKVRCAYCETILEYGGVQIEHFAPKSKYPQFVYEPLNLLCSCPVCNGLMKKGNKDTIIGNVDDDYKKNSFKYVHPYLDNPREEIKYRDPFCFLIDKDNSTKKGKDTIEMFHWDTVHATKKRISNKLTWSSSKDRRKMIAEILNYKE